MAIQDVLPVDFNGARVQGAKLSPAEETLIRRHVLDYVAQGNSWLQSLFERNMEAILGAAAVAKLKFDAPIMGLLAADNEVGLQLVRPGHILRSTATTETPANSWSFSFSSGGDYYVGYGTNNTTAARISQFLCMVILGTHFTQGAQPTVEELYWTIGQSTLPVQVIRHSWMADNIQQIRAARMHPLLLEPRQSVLVQPYSIAASTQELVLDGIAFGTGRYLRLTSYAAADLP